MVKNYFLPEPLPGHPPPDPIRLESAAKLWARDPAANGWNADDFHNALSRAFWVGELEDDSAEDIPEVINAEMIAARSKDANGDTQSIKARDEEILTASLDDLLKLIESSMSLARRNDEDGDAQSTTMRNRGIVSHSDVFTLELPSTSKPGSMHGYDPVGVFRWELLEILACCSENSSGPEILPKRIKNEKDKAWRARCYEKLARISVADFPEEFRRYWFVRLLISLEDLATWAKRKKFKLPKFLAGRAKSTVKQPSKTALESWYIDRVEAFEAVGEIPSREGDIKAAQERFGTVSHRLVQACRRDLAPSDWKKKGRRKANN